MTFDKATFQTALREGLQEWEFQELVSTVPSFERFAELIVETNETLNLTRILEPKEMAIKNVLDSLALLRLPWPNKLYVLDLGTGAGFPGVPLAICRPEWSVMLLDSLRKRLRFLESAAANLGLANIATLHARAEDAGQDKMHRQTYDLVVSRAVAHLPVLLELATPLVKVGGHFVAYKGSEAEEELRVSSVAMTKLQVSLEHTFDIELPLAMGARSLLVFKKEAPTPHNYPRRSGIPKKQPLG